MTSRGIGLRSLAVSVERNNIASLTAVEESDICFSVPLDITMTDQLVLRAKINVVVDLESNSAIGNRLDT